MLARVNKMQMRSATVESKDGQICLCFVWLLIVHIVVQQLTSLFCLVTMQCSFLFCLHKSSHTESPWSCGVSLWATKNLYIAAEMDSQQAPLASCRFVWRLISVTLLLQVLLITRNMWSQCAVVKRLAPTLCFEKPRLTTIVHLSMQQGLMQSQSTEEGIVRALLWISVDCPCLSTLARKSNRKTKVSTCNCSSLCRHSNTVWAL